MYNTYNALVDLTKYMHSVQNGYYAILHTTEYCDTCEFDHNCIIKNQVLTEQRKIVNIIICNVIVHIAVTIDSID